MSEISEINSVEDALKIIFSYDAEPGDKHKSHEWDAILNNTDTKYKYEFPFPFGIWFRWLSCAAYDLVPSVFRRQENDQYYRESALFHSFKLYNPAYAKNHRDHLSWLTLMQHYELPTRLLDWTENILTGLYFAAKNSNAKEEDSNGRLYVLYTKRLNRLTRMSPIHTNLTIPTSVEPQLFSFLAAENSKLDILESIYNYNLFEKVKLYNQQILDWTQCKKSRLLEYKSISYKMRTAVAVFPERLNARMQAQQSMFTIHGGKFFANTAGFKEKEDMSPVSLTELNKSQNPADKFLLYYSVPKESKKQILKDLGKIGIDQRSLFPDIDKQAGALKQLWLSGIEK